LAKQNHKKHCHNDTKAENPYPVYFFVITPATSLPTANEIAKILAIIILIFSGKCNTLSLKVGSHVIIPCSITLQKKSTDNEHNGQQFCE
jgi:hypothetical protein